MVIVQAPNPGGLGYSLTPASPYLGTEVASLGLSFSICKMGY
jgi:hypothetical protein